MLVIVAVAALMVYVVVVFLFIMSEISRQLKIRNELERVCNDMCEKHVVRLLSRIATNLSTIADNKNPKDEVVNK